MAERDGGGRGPAHVEGDRGDYMRRLKQWTLGLGQLGIVAGVLIGAIALNAVLSAQRTGPGQRSAEAAAPLVDVAMPSTGTHRVIATTTGTVEARALVNVAPQVGGRVIDVAEDFRAGGAFGAGDVLFRIDPADFRLAVERAQADLADAEARLQQEEAQAANSVRDWNRVYPDREPPPLVARSPQLAALRAAVDAARASLADARLDLERASFSFPFAGRVIDTTITEGQVLSPNQSYGQAYSFDGLEIVASLTPDQQRILDPIEGRAATVAARGGVEGEAPATVVRTGARLDPQTRLLQIRAQFDGPPPFVPGTFVSIAIQGPRLTDVVTLPVGAVEAGTAWVVENGELARRDLVVRDREGGDVVVDRFDMADGVVVSPLINPSAGQSVRVSGEGDGRGGAPGSGGTAGAGS